MDIAPYSDAIAGITSFAGKIVDKIWPDPAQAAAAKLQLLQMQQTGELAQLAADTDLMKGQLAIDNTEAASTSFFKSGWRPAVGWVCVAALAAQFIISPLVGWGAVAIFGKVIVLPALDMGTLMTLLMTLLGVGGMRTAEKLAGVAK